MAKYLDSAGLGTLMGQIKQNFITNVASGATDASNVKINVTKNGTATTVNIPSATTSAAGAMSANDKQVLTKLANRYQFGISSFAADPSVAELGAEKVVKLTWDFSNKDFHRVSSQQITATGAYTGSANPVDTKTHSFIIPKENITAGAERKIVTFTLNAKADANATTAEPKTCTTTFVHPSYCFVVAANKTAVTSDDIPSKDNNKAVLNTKSRTVYNISQTNQKLVYVYPSYFGNLTSIKDGNGFQGFSGYTKSTFSMGGTTYNAYIQNTPATATGSYTFA